MIRAVVAASVDHVIGVGDKIPWHLPLDLRHFKELTQASGTVVMGRHTYDSLVQHYARGKEPLPGREKYVITHQLFSPVPNTRAIFITNPEHFLKKLSTGHDVCIIGGAKIYELFNGLYDIIHLTVVDVTLKQVPRDESLVMNSINFAGYRLDKSVTHAANDKHAYGFVFEDWVKT